ncbi:MAG: thioredoxin [Chromatiales bacterium]|nr:thioredoxin [Chromatiales bacterium]MDH3894172.1 thioredoxin [Chromatiales bacterium]
MTTSEYVFDVRVEEFETRVLAASHERPVMVDFWAAWCEPCKMLTPVLEAVATKHEGAVLVAKVNSDDEPELAAQLGVRSLPTVMLFVEGAIVDRFVGVQSGAAVEQFIAAHLPRASDPQRGAAAALRAQGRNEEAAVLLREAAAAEPDDLQLRADLADLCIDMGRLEEADQLLARLPAAALEDPRFRRLKARALLAELAQAQTGAASAEDPEQLTQTAAIAALRGDHAAALDILMRVLRLAPGYKDGQAQAVIKAIFELLGEHDDLVGRYRRKMASALH